MRISAGVQTCALPIFVDGADEEDHPLLEQARVDVVGAFATAGLFDHHGDEVQGFGFVAHLVQLPIASWKVMACSVCWARSATQSITCSSITRFCSPAIRDRKSVVSGKSVSVRVDLGGRRIIEKKK